MAKNTYHVIAKIDGGWGVKREGAGRASRTFDTQKDAIEYGKNISKNNGTNLVIHDRNGRPTNTRSYERE